MVNIFLNGCCGRMGKAIAALCENNPDYKIVAGGDIIENNNYGFPVYTSLNECTEDFDVIIDFSNAKAVPAILEFALSRNKPFICCTTALSDDTVNSILAASEKIAVFKSANMSLGINMMVELCKQATRILYPEFDISENQDGSIYKFTCARKSIIF